jgi:hypothetical protein
MAASSAYASAPSIVMTPVRIHASRSRNGEPTVRAMSAETMKMPDPIIDPATSIVASVRVSAFTKSVCGSLARHGAAATLLMHRLGTGGSPAGRTSRDAHGGTAGHNLPSATTVG